MIDLNHVPPGMNHVPPGLHGHKFIGSIRGKLSSFYMFFALKIVTSSAVPPVTSLRYKMVVYKSKTSIYAILSMLGISKIGPNFTYFGSKI